MNKRLASMTAWVALAALCMGVVWLLTADELAAINEAEAVYSRKQELLSRLESLPAREALIRERLDDLGSKAPEQYLYDANHTGAQVLIQRDLRQIATQTSLNIGAMRTLGSPAQDGLVSRTSIQLSMTTTFPMLLDYLRALETWEPLLRVQRMSVRVQRASTRNQPAQLVVILEVAGFRRTKEEVGT